MTMGAPAPAISGSVPDAAPRLADPPPRPRRAPGLRDALQRGVELRVASGGGVTDDDPVAGDIDPAASGEPDQFGAHQPVIDPLDGRDLAVIGLDRQQQQIFPERPDSVHTGKLPSRPRI
jgi:hypothetical protein